MAIVQYTDKFWYPSGMLAVGVAVRVFPEHSNVLAPLFADLAGTIPLANPVTTDAGGFATFYVEAGMYWLHADTESFLTNIGLPEVTPAEFAAVQADVATLQGDMTAVENDVINLQTDVTGLQGAVTVLQSEVADLQAVSFSTGVVAGGDISVSVGSPSAITISPLVGYVVDMLTDPFNPTITRVEYPGATIEMDAGSLARSTTSWLLDSAGVVTQVASPTSNTQRRTHIRLGITTQVGGVITVDQSLPIILQQPANQLSDLMTALRPFSISGNLITPNGVNLQINQTAGQVFAQAFNHFSGPVQTNDPHVSPTVAQSPVSLRYVTRNSTVFGAATTLIDVANFDVGGVITPIGGGAGSSTIHRVWLFASNTAANQIVVQYGQATYTSLAAAADRVGAGTTFVVNPLLRDAALIGYIVVTRTATNLSDPAQAVFVYAGKFATP